MCYLVAQKIGNNGLIELSGLSGNNGFKLDGETAGDLSGSVVGRCRGCQQGWI